jgi:phosphate/sulfate permease
VGRGIYRIHAVDGLASQTTSADVILGASVVGAPVSTTQVVASSVIGVGVGRRRVRCPRVYGVDKDDYVLPPEARLQCRVGRIIRRLFSARAGVRCVAQASDLLSSAAARASAIASTACWVA